MHWLRKNSSVKHESSPVDPVSKPLNIRSLRNVAVLKLDHIGDLLLATPVFEALREACPQARITAVVGTWSQAVLKNNPFVDEVLTFDAPWLNRHQEDFDLAQHWKNRAATAHLLSASFDLVINLRSDHANVLLASLISSRHILSFCNDSPYTTLITHSVERPPGLHVLAQHTYLLSRIGIEVRGCPRLFPTREDVTWAKRVLQSGHVWVALFTGAGFKLKEWSSRNFLELAHRLSRMGLSLVVVGSKAEEPIGSRLERECDTLNLCGKTSLQQLACILKQVNILVSNDSAPVHIAASVGTSVVVITRPVVKDEFSPLGEGHTVLSVPACTTPCRGFDFRERTLPERMCRCIQAITVDEVELAVYKQLVEQHSSSITRSR